MPFDGNRWNLGKFVPYRSMLTKILAQWPNLERLEDKKNDTSKVRNSMTVMHSNIVTLVDTSTCYCA